MQCVCVGGGQGVGVCSELVRMCNWAGFWLTLRPFLPFGHYKGYEGRLKAGIQGLVSFESP